FFLSQAEDGIRDGHGLEFRRVLFRSGAVGGRRRLLRRPGRRKRRRRQQLVASLQRLANAAELPGQCLLQRSMGGQRHLQAGYFEIGRASCRESVCMKGGGGVREKSIE